MRSKGFSLALVRRVAIGLRAFVPMTRSVIQPCIAEAMAERCRRDVCVKVCDLGRVPAVAELLSASGALPVLLRSRLRASRRGSLVMLLTAVVACIHRQCDACKLVAAGRAVIVLVAGRAAPVLHIALGDAGRRHRVVVRHRVRELINGLRGLLVAADAALFVTRARGRAARRRICHKLKAVRFLDDRTTATSLVVVLRGVVVVLVAARRLVTPVLRIAVVDAVPGDHGIRHRRRTGRIRIVRVAACAVPVFNAAVCPAVVIRRNRRVVLHVVRQLLDRLVCTDIVADRALLMLRARLRACRILRHNVRQCVRSLVHFSPADSALIPVVGSVILDLGSGSMCVRNRDNTAAGNAARSDSDRSSAVLNAGHNAIVGDRRNVRAAGNEADAVCCTARLDRVVQRHSLANQNSGVFNRDGCRGNSQCKGRRVRRYASIGSKVFQPKFATGNFEGSN